MEREGWHDHVGWDVEEDVLCDIGPGPALHDDSEPEAIPAAL